MWAASLNPTDSSSCWLAGCFLLQALVARIDAEFGKGKVVFVKCNVADEKEVRRRGREASDSNAHAHAQRPALHCTALHDQRAPVAELE